MLRPRNKIIVVDNRKDQLDELCTPFYDSGLGCRGFLYDATYDSPLVGIRIAFFDINLQDLTAPEEKKAQIYATLVDALRLYISEHNGPYALVFWTSNAGLVGDFIQYVEDRHEVIARPISINIIDKHQFLDNANGNLEQKLQELLDDDTIRLLIDFEEAAFDSAAKTINQIYNIVPTTDRWGENAIWKENFEKIFSKVAQSSLGLSHAKKYPARAVYSALLPMLGYYIEQSVAEDKWLPVLTSLQSAARHKDLTYPESFNFSKLNSVFHVESAAEIKVDTRGAVIECSPVESPVNHMCACFEYFENLEQHARLLFELFVQFDNDASTRQERDLFRGASRFVLVEASAACDYSQAKTRVNKYILGLLSPVLEPTKGTNKSDAVFLLPDFDLQNEQCQLRLNFNFVYGLETSDPKMLKPIFGLKGTILDLIGTRYANHVSRIGITEFGPAE